MTYCLVGERQLAFNIDRPERCCVAAQAAGPGRVAGPAWLLEELERKPKSFVRRREHGAFTPSY